MQSSQALVGYLVLQVLHFTSRARLRCRDVLDALSSEASGACPEMRQLRRFERPDLRGRSRTRIVRAASRIHGRRSGVACLSCESRLQLPVACRTVFTGHIFGVKKCLRSTTHARVLVLLALWKPFADIEWSRRCYGERVAVFTWTFADSWTWAVVLILRRRE
ncbi:hypothetical protein DOTSEDRAFT_74689 [Dothistroma septosporum NZE10]|uniref:Uncharacterized protein n=1 Tax=Dothistroma septosporum (strain NZE10 / CBS 128990) TaxID=675120 RepID=N1PCC5_DOTSN|nr:hypothetical protein DOTSEDRAFT_74689 [Dothistroma septosporum NZE10]